LLSNTTVAHDAVIDTGASVTGLFYDTTQIDHLTVYHDLTLLGGGGTHSFSIKNSSITDELFMRLGSGEDGVEISNTNVGNAVDINTGAGNDRLSVSDSPYFGNNTLSIDLSYGDDSLTLANTNTGAATINGGDGVHDEVFRTNVNFRSLLLINFESPSGPIVTW